ncbi:MAG TPA: efflux RND transporter permease subunit [Vicinamibacterales bacterium]|nr:efflux RND transporter permease subunit [Vicinamibacterales bacterium]
MWLINQALRRPITVFVAALSLALLAAFAVRRMPVDIFPDLDLPVVIVAQPYGGMDPAQMEGYLTYYYEYHFLYIAGVDHVESKSVQGVSLVKIYFYPGTDMSQALAQVVSYVDRSRAFMPPGTVAPFVVRFDAGTVPVGQLVFSSETRGVGEIQDLALNRVRPAFATISGVSAPPPSGASQRSIVIRVDPDRLREMRMSPDEVARAVASGNAILPGGNLRTGDVTRIVQLNSPVASIRDLEGLPIRVGSGATVYLRDVATVNDTSDIIAGYALFNGRRTVYIPVTKRSDASTLEVVQLVKDAVPRFQALVPDDIQVAFEFDQSIYVTNALRGLTLEGLLGALLTGLMVWVFLRDWRSALIVIVTIPFALLGALVGLWLTGQTVNIMTLGGLALAIGILVDEATVAIENIHTHLSRGESRARAVLEAGRETLIPRLLAMLSILAVFVSSFFMTGVARSLFIPLSLAVGFAMMASYILSNTLVPVLAGGLLRETHTHRAEPVLDRLRGAQGRLHARFMAAPALLAIVYLLVTIGGVVLVARSLGSDMFPAVDNGQFVLRLRASTGTRIERTEDVALRALDVIRNEAGPSAIENSLMYVGTASPNYPINSIFLWSSGSHEALITVALRRGSGIRIADLQERLRQRLAHDMPTVAVSFEAGDIVSQIMNFGAPTPIEVAVAGPAFPNSKAFAQKVFNAIKGIPSLRDVQYEQLQDYPTVDITIDRERAGQLGVTVEQVGRSLAVATSSSRYVLPSYWRDPGNGIAYQVQVEVPQARVASPEDLRALPVMPSGAERPLVEDVADISFGTGPGEWDRYNQQRMLTISANVVGRDLGSAARAVSEAIRGIGEPPRGVTVNVRGQVPAMLETLDGLQTGVLVAIIAVFLLMAANFQSWRLAFVVLSGVPAVVLGVGLVLLATGTTLNVQSFMGAIMAIGVSVANAILLITFAENDRRGGLDADAAAESAVRHRIRPILMTSFAMVAGMLPMALALGEGGDQTAPLGRAVIGGLLASTVTVLLILPVIYAMTQRRASRGSGSWHPDDAATT